MFAISFLFFYFVVFTKLSQHAAPTVIISNNLNHTLNAITFNYHTNIYLKHLSQTCEVATFRKGVRAIQLVGRASELLNTLCMPIFDVLYVYYKITKVI